MIASANSTSIEEVIERSQNGRIADQDLEHLLIEATYAERLATTAQALLQLPQETLSRVGKKRAREAIRTCQSISDFSRKESLRLQNVFQERGIPSYPILDSIELGTLQHHSIFIEVPYTQIDTAISAAKLQGYAMVKNWVPAAWASYKHFRQAAELIRADDTTTRLVLSWKSPIPSTGILQRLKPTDFDYRSIKLPPRTWRLYPIVRIYNGLKSKLGRTIVQRHDWPFLGTPRSLVKPLLGLAEVKKDDCVIDIGCGDARILVEATKRYGCSSIGIESDDRLVAIARDNIEKESLSEKIEVHSRSAKESDFAAAKVIFLFLPVNSIEGLLNSIQRHATKGTRLIVHEHEKLNTSLPPTQSTLILGECALTVAHLWRF